MFCSEEVSFFELSSIESFVEAVENVKKCAEKVDQAYNRFISTYSPEIFYKRYISIYETQLYGFDVGILERPA